MFINNEEVNDISKVYEKIYTIKQVDKKSKEEECSDKRRK